MKKIFYVLFLLITGNGLQAQAPNQNISNYAFPDTEPHITVNPANPNNVIAAWMKVTGAQQVSIATSYSNDGGSTWSIPQNMPHLYTIYTSADPSIDFNSAGTAYLCYIDFAPTQDSGKVVVASSTNGGMTWSAPVGVTDGLETGDKPIDRPWVNVDRSGGSNDGNVYVVSINVEGTPNNHVYQKHSNDGGLTWSNLMIVDDSIPADLMRTGGSQAVGADGAVYIGYFSWHTAMSPLPRVILRKSTDGGITYNHTIVGTIITPSGINDTLQGSVMLSANPNNANNLILTFTDGRNGDADILSIRSTDGGQTWNFNSPVRVNDDALSNGNEQDMCWAGFAPDGTYCTAWRDRRSSGNLATSPFEIWMSASFDEGATFRANKKVSTAISPDIALDKGNDFIGISLSNTFVHLDWCDARGSNWEIYYSRDSLSALTGIRETEMPDHVLTCYPNPFLQTIHCDLHLVRDAQNANISLYDLSGKKIVEVYQGDLSAGKHAFTFQTGDLPVGTYLLKLRSATLKASQVLIRQ